MVLKLYNDILNIAHYRMYLKYIIGDRNLKRFVKIKKIKYKNIIMFLFLFSFFVVKN